MDPNLPTNKQETTPRGCLKLNNKIYSVYDGHNTIGRDPHAVINIKSLTISKSHAIITVFNENSHYISDFKSANGTRLDSKKLTPLKLYELKNGSSVRFGDVFCTYKKLGENERVDSNTEASQHFSESFYGANTQDVREFHLPDAINFNEMPTQIFAIPEPNINDMPTQLHNFDDSNESIDFVTMQKAETQLVTDDKPLSQIVPVGLNSKKVLDSGDSETDEDLTPSQVKPVKTSKKNVIESDSDTEEYAQPVDDGRSRYDISDDSETDIEEDKKSKDEEGKIQQSTLAGLDLIISDVDEEKKEENGEKEERKTHYQVAGPDHAYCQTPQNSQTQNLDEILAPKEEEKSTALVEEIGNKEDIAGEKVTDQQTDVPKDLGDQPIQLDSTSSEVEKIDEPKQQMDDAASPNSEKNTAKELEADVSNQPTEQLDAVSSNTEENTQLLEEDLELFNQPTQAIDTSLNVEEKPENSDKKQDDNETQDLFDIFDQPTQQVDLDLVTSKGNTESQAKEDDIYLQPTQTLDYLCSQKVAEGQKDDDNIYLQPTQALEQLHGEKPEGSSEAPVAEKNTQNLEALLEDDEDKDDSILPPTQALEAMHGDDKSPSVKPSTSRAEQDDLPSTQALETLLTDDSRQDKRSEFVLPPPPDFKTPSPYRKKTKRQSTPKTDEDEDFLQPTQAMEALHQDHSEFSKVQDEMYEIFASQSLLATQQLVDVLDDDIIDDSINEETGKSSYSSFPTWSVKKPISAESVKEILGEGVEDEGVLNVTGKTNDGDNVKTYSRKKGETDDVSEESSGSGIKNANAEGSSSTKEVTGEEKIKNEDTSGGGNKRTKRQDDTDASSNKTGEKNDKDTKEIVEGTRKRRGRRKQSLNASKQDEEVVGQRNQNKNTSDDGRGKKKQGSEDNKDTIEETTTRRGRKKRNLDTSKVDNDKKEPSAEQAEDKKGRGDTNENKDQNRNNKKEESKEKANETVNRRGRRRLNLETSSVDKEDDKKETTTKGRGRRKENPETPDPSAATSSGASKDEADVKTTRQTRAKQDKNEEDKDESQESTTSEGTKKRGRRRLLPPVPDFQETHSDESNQNDEEAKQQKSEGNKRRGRRRKQEESKENEDDTNNVTTPKKMKKEEIKNESSSTSSPKKRTFKTASLGSEDDFETKAPKLESVKRSPRGRKVKELQESNEEVISVSSGDVISISSTSTVETPTRGRRLSANSRRQKREQEAEIPTPERSRRVLKPKVVFTMMDSPELESLIRQLGGSVVDTVESCTVLVTQQVKRTLKLLSAVAQGKPICSPQWLQACKRAGSFVDPYQHILVDKEAEKKWNFSLKEAIDRGSKGNLLENHTFQLIVNTAADVLKGSIEACGGKCVTRNLANSGTENLFIVSTEANKGKYSKIVKQNPSIKVIEAEAIFDGTLRQEFKFDNFLVS